MPRLKHLYGQKHPDYLTANAYRKARIFDSNRSSSAGWSRSPVISPGPAAARRYYYLDDSAVLAIDRPP